jgi:hypothetical protein
VPSVEPSSTTMISIFCRLCAATLSSVSRMNFSALYAAITTVTRGPAEPPAIDPLPAGAAAFQTFDPVCAERESSARSQSAETRKSLIF